MKPPYLNRQDLLAAEFLAYDDQVLQLSRMSILKLASLKLARKDRLLTWYKKEEIEDFVQATLMNAVPSSFVLDKEGYSSNDLRN